ncbi:MAG: hypothetical protein ACRDIY_00130 [Chloroflexota bacterium]
MEEKRVAAIVTEYRPRSHADVIVGKLVAPYLLDGVLTQPRLRVASLFTDQIAAQDLSRQIAAEHAIPIAETIEQALTLGGSSLAVDGVVLVGEHGDYPTNDLGQKLYPRRRLFEAIVETMRKHGQFVPIFSDKHLSYSWENARWMYDTALALGIPLLAGSSLPVTWRQPPCTVPAESEIGEALGIAHGPLDAYGFHALEMVQCMVERRRGGETGVTAVRCVSGPAVKKAADEGVWSSDLFSAAAARLGVSDPAALIERATDPTAFVVEYGDGLRVTVLMLNGAVSEFAFAGRIDGAVASTKFYLESQEPFGHFAFLVRAIEDLVLNGRPPYPVERTLLTTGILALTLESRYREGIRLPTPELGVRYRIESDL